MGKRILLYSHFYLPESGAAPVRISNFVRVLKQAGHEVKIITPQPNYPLGRIFDGYKNWIDYDKDENIVRLPIYLPKKHSLFGRLFSYISYFFPSLVYTLFDSFKPDIILSSSPPIVTSYAAAIVARLCKCKFIFDARDVWPDIGVELGILKNQTYIKQLERIEKYILKTSDAVLVTAEGNRLNIEAKSYPKEKLYLVYNGADTELFKPTLETEYNRIRTQYGIPTGKKILIYFGSFNHGMNDIDLLGDALSDLPEEIKKGIHVLAIGDGDKREVFIKKIEKQITHTHYPSLPNDKIAEILGCCDISLIPRKQISHNTGDHVPVKCFESWASAVPVILSSPKGSNTEEIFKKCGAGYIVEPDDKRAFSDAIKKLLQDDISSEMGLRGRNFVIKYYDRIKQAEQLLQIIESFYPTKQS